MPGRTARSRVAKSAPRAKARFCSSTSATPSRRWRSPTARASAGSVASRQPGSSQRRSSPLPGTQLSLLPHRSFPAKNAEVTAAANCPVCWVGPGIELGIGVDYPKPETIGADRLANAVACAELYGAPAVVVDFGTAATIRRRIAGQKIRRRRHRSRPERNDRVPASPYRARFEIRLAEPIRAVGKTTKQAMLSGAGTAIADLFARSSPR